MARGLSIRSRLIGDLSLVIIVFGVAVSLLVFLGARSAVRTLSRQLITRQIDDLAERLDIFFAPAREAVQVGEGWGAEGLLDPDRPEDLRTLFQPLLHRFPQISAILVADDRGREYMLTRQEGKWVSREVRRDEWGSRAKWREWAEGQPGREEWREIDYDPRERPWFRGAMERAAETRAGRRICWTEPYRFFTAKKPGITAAAAFRSGDRTRVLGVDILLEDISDFTMRLGEMDQSTIFVLTRGDLVVGLPPQLARRPPEERTEALLKHPSELGIEILRDAAVRLGPEAAVRFESGGKAWWGGRREYVLGPELEISVAVPEERILGGLETLRYAILGLAVASLALALWRAVALARRFSRPIEALVEQSDRIRRGDLEPRPPVESRVAEIRRLADAQERMRASLTKLLHLEGELRIARRIQEGTFPGRLPVLAGFDCAGFTLPASETGGDTYDAVGIAADGTLSESGAARALLLVADATGHGIGPALSVTQVRAMLRMAARTGLPIAEIVLHLNEQLHDDLESGRFVTMWLGELDATRSTLTSFSAGQGPLLHYDAARGAWEERNADAPPLGIVPRIAVDLPPPLTMRQGDLFVVLSDGFYEAASPSGELFGSERVRRVVEEQRAKPAEGILKALLDAVEAHLSGTPAADDRTALLIKRTG
jgi:serine phosphatase RsbU (regulator of sigma subunit)